MSTGSEKLERVRAALQEEFELGARKKEDLGYYTCAITPKDFSESAGINGSQLFGVLRTLSSEGFIKGYKIDLVYDYTATRIIEDEIAIQIFFPLTFNKEISTGEKIKEAPLAAITFSSAREIVLNYQNRKYILSKPEFGGKNESFFEYIYKKQNERITEKDIKESVNLEGKTPNKIVDELGFKGILRQMFFPAGVTIQGVIFKSEISREQLEELEITENDIKKVVAKLERS